MITTIYNTAIFNKSIGYLFSEPPLDFYKTETQRQTCLIEYPIFILHQSNKNNNVPASIINKNRANKRPLYDLLTERFHKQKPAFCSFLYAQTSLYRQPMQRVYHHCPCLR